MSAAASQPCRQLISAVLIDLSGTLHIGKTALPGAAAALAQLPLGQRACTTSWLQRGCNPFCSPFQRLQTPQATKFVAQAWQQAYFLAL